MEVEKVVEEVVWRDRHVEVEVPVEKIVEVEKVVYNDVVEYRDKVVYQDHIGAPPPPPCRPGTRTRFLARGPLCAARLPSLFARRGPCKRARTWFASDPWL